MSRNYLENEAESLFLDACDIFTKEICAKPQAWAYLPSIRKEPYLLMWRAEANSKFWPRSRDMCTFWSFGGVKSGQISAARMKIKILLGSPTQYPILGPHAKNHASSFSNFFWRVPGFESAFASSIPSVFVEEILNVMMIWTINDMRSHQIYFCSIGSQNQS